MRVVRQAPLMLACVAMLAASCSGGGSSDSNAALPLPPNPGSPPAPLPSTTVVSNPDGPCLTIRGETNRVVENMTIGPCGGAGIEILDSTNVILRNVTIRDTRESGVHIGDSTSVQVSESHISNAASGVYAVGSSGIQVQCSTISNPQGPMPRGQFVQFDKMIGGENVVSCNSGLNEYGMGMPEDQINLYQSSGTASLPIMIVNNLLQGGGPSESGGGIMLGDSGGAYQIARGNVVVNPGQYGIAAASGTHISIEGNLVYSRQEPITNVGIYVWNQYATPCNAVAVANNQVNWLNKAGAHNPWWDGGNCGAIAGVPTNDFAAAIAEGVAKTARPPAECSCQNNGWR